MKKFKILLVSICIVISFESYTQTIPSTIKYQAVVRDAQNNVYPDKNIGVECTFIDNLSGQTIYTETHLAVTSSLGLINLELGGGQPSLGLFEDIDWSSSNFSLEVGIDLDGGNNYQTIGSSPILSVPIALQAMNAVHATMADSISTMPQLSYEIIQNDLGQAVYLNYDGNTIPIDDADFQNELIKEMYIDSCNLVIVEGEEGLEYDVDLTDLLSYNTISTDCGNDGVIKYCEKSFQIEDADAGNELIKSVFLDDCFLVIKEGEKEEENSVDLSMFKSPWQEDVGYFGGITYTPSDDAGIEITDGGSIIITNNDGIVDLGTDGLDFGGDTDGIDITTGPMNETISVANFDTLKTKKVFTDKICAKDYILIGPFGKETKYWESAFPTDGIKYEGTDADVTIQDDGVITVGQFVGKKTAIACDGISFGTAIDSDGITIDSAGTSTAILDTIMSKKVFANRICVDSISFTDGDGNIDITVGGNEIGNMSGGSQSDTTSFEKITANNICITDTLKQGPDTSAHQSSLFYIPNLNATRFYARYVLGEIKSFIIPNPNKKNGKLVYSCVEGPEAAAYERGVGTLVNGEGDVKFSEHFKSIVNHTTATVQLTPKFWDTFGVAVVETTATGFRVKELKGGQGNFEFNWEVKAVRKGFENYRVERSEEDYMYYTDEDLKHAGDE